MQPAELDLLMPVDVTNSSALEKRACHVLDDHSHSHPAHVANSCTWDNLWVDSDYVHQNMAITLTLVQHDTDEELWLKCLETCEEHAPVQQGGPLMLFLILQRIQDRSLDVLKIRVAQLDISKLKGQDVEQAARLVLSSPRVGFLRVRLLIAATAIFSNTKIVLFPPEMTLFFGARIWSTMVLDQHHGLQRCNT